MNNIFQFIVYELLLHNLSYRLIVGKSDYASMNLSKNFRLDSHSIIQNTVLQTCKELFNTNIFRISILYN